MKHLPLTLALLLALAGCGKGAKSLAPIPPPPPPSAGAPATQQAQDRMVMQNLQLFQYDRKSVGGKPRIEITAEKATSPQDETWNIEGAKAVIHTAKDDDVRLSAANGAVDQRKEKESAFLRDGVVMETKTNKVEMKSAQWLNQDGFIKSDDPVVVTGQDITINATSLVYYPDSDQLQLANVSGVINLQGRATP